MECEEFICKFKSLDGITLGERKKSFYILLKSITPTSNALDGIIQKLKATTYLEKYYEIELLIYFKRVQNLLEILMIGEEIGACKIVRQDWFIKELMNIYTPLQFIENIVPKLSFSIRVKLFKRIYMNVKDENVLDEFYEQILNAYGMSNALIFLPGCSNLTIEESFSKYSIHLSVSQLKSLYHKNKELIDKYFIFLSENGLSIDTYERRSFFLYIAKLNPLFYSEMCEKFNIDKIKLGRQSTKKYIKAKKEQIIQKPYEYYRFLRKDVLVRKLGIDFPLFYKNLLPENINEFNFFSAKSVIKYFPKRKQYELYFNTFAEVYNKSLWDNVEYMDQNLIEFVQDKDEREKWISKFENRQNIKKYRIKKKCAMHFIEDKGEKKIRAKKTIFNTLVSTCKLTKDYDAFLNILKSFRERHRNSDVVIVYNFFRTIYKELDLTRFKDGHWQYIYDIITIQIYKKQQIFLPIFLEYIKFQFIEEKPIDDFVHTFLRQAPSDFSKFIYNNHDFERTMLVLYLKFLPELTDRKKEIAIQVAISLITWNTKHPLECITFSEQKDIINSIMEQSFSGKLDKSIIKVLKYLICTQDGKQIPSELDEFYWSHYEKLHDNTITDWFLKYRPLMFLKYSNKIGLILQHKNPNLVRKVKKYSHLNIPQHVTIWCLQELKTCEPSKSYRFVRMLIYFMEYSDLYQYLIQYVPNRDDVDQCVVLDKNKDKIFAIQCALAKYSKLSYDIKMLLPILLKYCTRSIFSSLLSSIYSCFHRIPQNELYSWLNILNEYSVSVRKHTIFLTSQLFPLEKFLLKCEQIKSCEKSFSVKQHMFTSCYKFFIRNESHECFNIITNYLDTVKVNQKDVLKLITNIHQIPRSYRPKYAEYVWNVLDKFKESKVLVDDRMFAFLNNLTLSDIIQLNTQFCSNIFENKLYNREECTFNKSVTNFCKNFLLYSAKNEKKLEVMATVIQQLGDNAAEDFDKQRHNLDIIHSFCFNLLVEVLTTKDTQKIDSSFLESFKAVLLEKYSIEEIFEEKILFEIALFKIECRDFKESFPLKINELFSSEIEEFGYLVWKRFKECTQRILDILYPNDCFNVFIFLIKFLSEHTSSSHYVLAINLMPPIYTMDDKKTKNEFYKLLEILKSQDEIIKIILNRKLKGIDNEF